MLYWDEIPLQIVAAFLLGMSVTKLMTKAYILEAAIASHTIIIGFDFGSLDDSELSKIKILMAAFAFHQV